MRVPAGTRALIARLQGVGRDHPLSIEKLCPVLSFYVVKDWREGCERCKQILRYGGMGHTMSIHSRNDAVILEFGLHKPAYRICVNTPTTHGSIGLTTGPRPGDDAGVRRLWRQHHVGQHLAPTPAQHQATGVRTPPGHGQPSTAGASCARSGRLSRRHQQRGAWTARIDQYLKGRGFAPAGQSSLPRPRPPTQPRASNSSTPPTPPVEKPAAFVCEDDVRQAIRAGQTLTISDKTIVTPSARDLGEAQRVFRHVGTTGPVR